MMVVSLKEMAQKPSQTLYAEYEPCFIGELRIKKSLPGEERWLYSDLLDFESTEGQDIQDALLNKKNVKDNIPIDYEETYLSDIYLESQLFLVFSVREIKGIANNLNKLLNGRIRMELIYR